MAGIADVMAIPTNVMAVGGQVGGLINQMQGIQRSITQKMTMTNVFSILTVLFAIGKCLFTFFDMIYSILKWLFYDFPIWFATFYILWLLEYIICSFDKIMMLPKCFLWYGLDTASWIVYLPFRFVFWLLDSIMFSGKPEAGKKYPPIQQMEHDFWCFMDDVDHFVHDKNSESLGTGFHIIHFPDSVMHTCYRCKIRKWKSMPKSPVSKVLGFMKCITRPF